jgi:hypothetical protein
MIINFKKENRGVELKIGGVNSKTVEKFENRMGLVQKIGSGLDRSKPRD